MQTYRPQKPIKYILWRRDSKSQENKTVENDDKDVMQ